MIENIKKISNPLTIFAIFSGLAEISATTVLPFLVKDLQSIFIWYVMGFPILLVLLFVITWNFNPKVMYAPSDFKDEKNFLSTLGGTYLSDKSIMITKDNYQNISKSVNESVNNFVGNIPSDIDSKEFEKFSGFVLKRILETNKDNFENKIIERLFFTVQSAEYYLLRLVFTKLIAKDRVIPEEYFVFHFSKKNSVIELEIIGKEIKGTHPDDIVLGLNKFIENRILQMKKENEKEK